MITNADLTTGTLFLNGQPVSSNPDGPANPCGLIAKSVFTDAYTITGVSIDETNIAWKSDI